MPEAPSSDFVAAMEDVLEVYHRPYDPERPVVCMDEASKQLIAEVREPLPAKPGSVAKHDSEYERRGTANLFMAVEPLAGKRTVQVTERRTKIDWAQFIKLLLLTVYPKAVVVVLVMDNLNTHGIGSLYEAFDPETARSLAARLEVSILSRQCLDRRIECKALLASEVDAWERERHTRQCKIDWQFTTADARIKLKRLYPLIHE